LKAAEWPDFQAKGENDRWSFLWNPWRGVSMEASRSKSFWILVAMYRSE
jgi:hypothetical protein